MEKDSRMFISWRSCRRFHLFQFQFVFLRFFLHLHPRKCEIFWIFLQSYHSKKTTALTTYRSQHRLKAESQHLKFLFRLQVQSIFLSTRPSAFQWRRHPQSDVPVLVEVAPHQLLRFCPSSWQHWRCCCCPGRPAVPRRTALSRSWWRATIL